MHQKQKQNITHFLCLVIARSSLYCAAIMNFYTALWNVRILIAAVEEMHVLSYQLEDEALKKTRVIY